MKVAGLLLVIAAVAIVLASFFIAGALAAACALACFAIGAAVIFLAMRIDNERPRLTPPLAASERTNDPLRAIVGGLPDPVIALDREKRVLALNEPARALAPALRQGEAVSLTLRMPELIDAVGRAFARGEEQRIEYSERVPVDRWFQAVAMPVRRTPDATMPDLVLLTFRDLTPLRRVEEMRADFVANASHELRTPLAAIKIAFETLREVFREDPDQTERCVTIIDGHLRRLEEMLRDLLDLSRVENADIKPRVVTVKTADLLQAVKATMGPMARAKNVELRLGDSDPATPLDFRTDLRLLNLVVKNLVENSIKFTPAAGKVTVSISKSPSAAGNVVLSVADTGIGIAPEHRERVFERFYQVDSVRTGAGGRGTGLGLAIVKHAVHALGGTVTLQSAVGAGTTVMCEFPQPAQPEVEPEPALA